MPIPRQLSIRTRFSDIDQLLACHIRTMTREDKVKKSLVFLDENNEEKIE
jgi:hypothetical protein